MEKVLPKGWVETRLGDVTTKPQYGWTTKSTNVGKYKYLRTTDIGKGSVDWSKVPFCQYLPDDIEKYLLKENDILISRAGSIGLSYLVGSTVENSLFASYLIRFKPFIIPKFVSYYLNSMDYWKAISDNAVGIAVQNINAPKLQAIPFPLPPLPEQERIVAKLDKLFAQHEKIKKALDRIPQLLKAFRQQVLDNEYRPLKNYDMLSSCCHKIQDGAHHSPKKIYSEKLNGTYPYITSKNIRDNYMKLDSVQYVDEEFHNSIYERCKPEFGDVLLTKDGANTGNVTLNSLDEPFSLLSSVCLIKPKREILLPAFIKYYFQSDIGRSNLLGEMTGTAIKRIVLRKIKTMQIPLPSLHEQQEIVSRIESLFAKADAIESRYQTLKAKIDNLPQAILHKAFKGELVPQLPTDGDAKDLLAEIMALKEEVKRRKR